MNHTSQKIAIAIASCLATTAICLPFMLVASVEREARQEALIKEILDDRETKLNKKGAEKMAEIEHLVKQLDNQREEFYQGRQ